MSYQLCLNRIIEQYRNANPPIKIPRSFIMSETYTPAYSLPTEDCLCLIVRKGKTENDPKRLQLAYFKKRSEHVNKAEPISVFATIIMHNRNVVNTQIDSASIIPIEEVVLWASVSIYDSVYSVFNYDVCNLEAIINALLIEKYDGKNLAQSDEHIKRLTSEVERLNKAVSSISKEKQELFLKNEELTAESNELQEINERYCSEKCEAESKQKALEASIKQFQSIIDHGEATANDLAEHNETLKLQVAELTKQNAELQSRLDSSQKNPASTVHVVNNYHVVVSDKEAALETLRNMMKNSYIGPPR